MFITVDQLHQLWPSDMREYYTAATRTHCSILGLNEPHGSDFKPKKPDPEKYLQSQSIYSLKSSKAEKRKDTVKNCSARW